MHRRLKTMANHICEFYSPINLESSWGVLPVSDNMRSTMEFLNDHKDGCACIEWIVWDADGNDEYVEHIGIWYDILTNQITDYDGVFALPNEAIQLLLYAGYNFDPEEWAEELACDNNPTFTILINK
jgi:hypothetical protein